MTTPISVSEVLGDIKQYVYNPGAIFRKMVEVVNRINEGKIEIVDATNPFVLAMETSAVNTAALMQGNAAHTRQQYAVAATTFEDLYLHMSDADYQGIFALPSEVDFLIAIDERQLLGALVLDEESGVSKVTIPRNTVFRVQDMAFSLQYPVDIRKLEHGALQIVYDASVVSPLENLVTNVVNYQRFFTPQQQPFLLFALPTQQFDIVSRTSSFNSVSGTQLAVDFPDQFYAARVYVTVNGAWQEIAVTYTDQVYDPNTPTAALKVVGSRLHVRIPLVYINNNQVSGSFRVDVYYTKGPLEAQLGNYSRDSFTASFRTEFDQADATPYVAALKSIANIFTYAETKPTGGRNALSFDELQRRVITNSTGPRRLPITPAQIQSILLDKGYSLVKNIDVLTDRFYWATKPLPAPVSSNLVTTANANVTSIVLKTTTAALLQGCYEHSTGMTISSSALVQTVNGASALVTKAAYAALVGQPTADQVSAVNAGKYSFTPFHYVLDTTTDSFSVRPYYLDEPKVPLRTFVQENPATGLQVSVNDNFGIEKTQNGFRLIIQTKSEDAYKELPDDEVFCQLAFNSPAQAQSAYMLGQLQERENVSDERVFIFDITSVYDLNEDNMMVLTSFITGTGNNQARSALTQEFSVIFGTSNEDAVQNETTEIDTYIGAFQVPDGSIGLTREVLTIRFGYALTTLWNSYRSFVDSIPYQRYVADVPKLYEKDIYERDSVTGAEFEIVNGSVVWNILHHAGDPVIGSDDEPVYLHRVGDLVLDSQGRPTPVENYRTEINRMLEILTLDGVYQFANDQVTQDYVKRIKQDLINSITVDMVELNKEALERTQIFYYPAITQGTVSVLADNNQIVNLEASQSLKIELHVPQEVFVNKNLTASLQSATIQTCGNFLATNATVAISNLEEELSQVYGSDVLAVTASGLGGDRNYRVISVLDESTRLSISKSLRLLPSGQMAVLEDISVSFNPHGQSAA